MIQSERPGDWAYCPVCKVPNRPIGSLGSIAHYFCRSCGVHYSPPDEVADELSQRKKA